MVGASCGTKYARRAECANTHWRWSDRRNGGLAGIGAQTPIARRRDFGRCLALRTGVAEPLIDVIIVGAGIGGLTLALTLHRAGIAARICEAAPAITPLGAGINILP